MRFRFMEGLLSAGRRSVGFEGCAARKKDSSPRDTFSASLGEALMERGNDYLIFRSLDVDLRRSPLRRSLAEPTHVLGAFNPGLARLAGGNLLLVVRVAEALSEPVEDGHVRAIRRTPDRYVLDPHPLSSVRMTDPRQFSLRQGTHPRSEEHTSELQSRQYLVCRLLLEKKKKNIVMRDRSIR